MKMNKIFAFAAGLLTLAACSDFEEINKNPKAAGAADLKPQWALNKAIMSDQQNPNDAERVFVLYWADLGRQDGENSGRSVGGSNDEWAGCLYNLTRNCVTSCNNAIQIADDAIAGGTLGARDAVFYKNVKSFSRIWRVYLMTEFVDSFGCFTTDFESTTPEYKSVQECYDFMFSELAAAIPEIDLNTAPTKEEAESSDNAYGLDPLKWKNFGISMWMRIAMRLSEVDANKAKSEFEKAVAAGSGIRDINGTFRVAEKSGWWDLSGVMSRTWDWQETSHTMANLMTNLGGNATTVLQDKGGRFYTAAPLSPDRVNEIYGPYIKDASTYLGVHLVNSKGENLYEENTDSPTYGYFFDGIPSKIDPRALVYYTLPCDYAFRKETGYASFPNWYYWDFANDHVRNTPAIVDGKEYPYFGPLVAPIDKLDENSAEIDASFAFNGLIAGYGRDDKYTKSFGLYDNADIHYGKTYPALAERYRDNNEFRVFFGPWETYFLLAEAALRGWNAGISAQDAYEAGIKINFEYLNISDNYNEYINSESYNRVGTSVKFTHTAEPQNYTINYTDPVSGTQKKYKYPEASKTLYGKALNDQLAKIITQKYIANTPWLPLENWSDHRRLGLPFWELPVSTTDFPYLMDGAKNAYLTGQKVGCYAQRMNYPNSFKNASPEQYQNAIQLMGMTNENTITPLWWAKK